MPRKTSSKPKIGAVGTINRDTIFQIDGGHIESWGGLLYSLKYLCDGDAADVMPIVNVGRDSYRAIMLILGGIDYIDLSGIREVKEKNNHCFLHYHNQSHKCEILKGSVPPLTYGRIKSLLDCDLILVNFISGPDVKLAALEKLRREYSGIIYMDIHSLTLGRNKVPGGYRRFLRRPRYWQRYASCADILQVNMTEFEILSGRKYSRQNALKFVAKELNHPECLVVTKGAEGSNIYYKRGGKFVRRNISPVKIRKVYDTTGCGDIFGAGFIVEYLKSGSFIKAAQNGNRLAAARCRLKGAIF